MSKPDFSSLAEAWPSTFVERSRVGEFSGGVLHPRSLANADCSGTGPKGRVRIGRKIAYPVTSLIEYLESRATRLN